MADFEFELDEVAALADKLDGFDDVFDGRDRALLVATFAMAGEALRPPTASGVDGDERSAAGPADALEARVAALEARLAELEGGGGLERTSLVDQRAPTIRLRTEEGAVPRLSEGFVGSFRPGQIGRVAAGDDVSVGVSVGVMF